MVPLIHPLYFFLEGAPETQSLWDTIVHSNLLNFFIAVAFLGWVFVKFDLSGKLTGQRDKIIQDLKEAEAKRQKALTDLEAVEQRLSSLNREVEAILADAREGAELLAQSLLKQAEADADAIVRHASRHAAMEKQRVSRELEKRLMSEAIYSARQLLENTLNEQDKHRTIEDFVAVLPEIYQSTAQKHPQEEPA